MLMCVIRRKAWGLMNRQSTINWGHKVNIVPDSTSVGCGGFALFALFVLFALFARVDENTHAHLLSYRSSSFPPHRGQHSAHTSNMRVLQFLTAAALSLSAVAVKKAPSAYDVFSKKHAPVSLTEQSYNELTDAPRDYHAAVVFTALDAKYACGVCREFLPEWDVLARSWQRGSKKGDHRLVFGTLDFDQGKNVFIKVGDPIRPQPCPLNLAAPIANRSSPLPLPSYHWPECFA